MKYQTVKCSDRLPESKYDEKLGNLSDDVFVIIDNGNGEHFGIDYYDHDFNRWGKLYNHVTSWLEPTTDKSSDVQTTQGAEELCKIIEKVLSSVKMMHQDSIGDGKMPLIDYLSDQCSTIEQGKEEISNIVEQIFFSLKDYHFASSQRPTVSEWEIDFNGYCKTKIAINNNTPTILAAMNGYGGGIRIEDISVYSQPTEENGGEG